MLDPRQFVPVELRQFGIWEQVCQLIEHINVVLPEPKEEIDPIIKLLLGSWESDESVLAYYNIFIRPVIGTRTAIEAVLQLTSTDAVVFEWFELPVPLPPFKFDLIFEQFPGYDTFDLLIDLILAYKNERSWLSSMRMWDCPTLFVLDYSNLDEDILDTIYGYIYRGVFTCFYHSWNLGSDIDTPESISVMHTRLRSYYYVFPWTDLYDYYVFDYPINIPPPLVNHYRYTTTWLVPDIPGTWNEPAYHIRTFLCQVVLDDYGTLSGGEGFIERQYFPSENFRLDELLLSDEPVRIVDIIEFFWPVWSRFLDFGLEPQVSSFRTSLRSIWVGAYDIDQLGWILLDGGPGEVDWSKYREIAKLFEFRRTWLGRWDHDTWSAPYRVSIMTNWTHEPV